jgi:predicted HNH restriction endonuclease
MDNVGSSNTGGRSLLFMMIAVTVAIFFIYVINIQSNKGSISNIATSDDVAEGQTNLYYTDERARNAISVDGDLQYDSQTGVIEYSSAVTSVNTKTKDVVLETDDVAEGQTNLYYTDERARGAISVDGDLQYDPQTGVIEYSSAVTSVNTKTKDVVLETDDVAEGQTNLYYTDERARGAISVDGDLQYDSQTGVIEYSSAVTSVNTKTKDVVLETDDVAEGQTNLYYTDERARNAISVDGDLQYDPQTGVIEYNSAVTSVNTKTKDVVLETDDVAEGQTNLYYTDERARNAISVDGDLQYDSQTGVIEYSSAVTSVNTKTKDVVLETDDVAEGQTNLYYTDERARNAISVDGDLQYDPQTGVIEYSSAVTSVNTKTKDVVLETDDVAEGQTNLYYTDERARNAISVDGDLQYDSQTGVIEYSSAVTSVNTKTKDVVLETDDVAEGQTNLYYTDERARNAISVDGDLQYDPQTGVIEYSSAVTSVNTKTKDVVLETDDVAEGQSNLYYTDERARSAISVDGNILSFNVSTGTLSANILSSIIPIFSAYLEGFSSTSHEEDLLNFNAPDIIVDNISGYSSVSSSYTILVEGLYDINISIVPSDNSYNYRLSVFKNTDDLGIGVNVNTENGNIFGSFSGSFTAPFTPGDNISFKILADRTTLKTIEIQNISVTVKYIPPHITSPAMVSDTPVISVNGLDGIVNLNTSNVPEGVNLYFTPQRARESFTSGDGIKITDGMIEVEKIISKVEYLGETQTYTSQLISDGLEDISFFLSSSFDLSSVSLWDPIKQKIVIPLTGYYRISGQLNFSNFVVICDINDAVNTNIPVYDKTYFSDILYLNNNVELGIYFNRTEEINEITITQRSPGLNFQVKRENYIILEYITK